MQKRLRGWDGYRIAKNEVRMAADAPIGRAITPKVNLTLSHVKNLSRAFQQTVARKWRKEATTET